MSNNYRKKQALDVVRGSLYDDARSSRRDETRYREQFVSSGYTDLSYRKQAQSAGGRARAKERDYNSLTNVIFGGRR